MDFHRGTYRVRGDIIDIFPAESEKEAIRIELFDNEIENLNYFDPLTGEILKSVPRLTVFPKTHYVTPREKILSTIDLIKIELKERLEELYKLNKLVEAQRLEQRTLYDLEMMLNWAIAQVLKIILDISQVEIRVNHLRLYLIICLQMRCYLLMNLM